MKGTAKVPKANTYLQDIHLINPTLFEEKEEDALWHPHLGHNVEDDVSVASQETHQIAQHHQARVLPDRHKIRKI